MYLEDTWKILSPYPMYEYAPEMVTPRKMESRSIIDFNSMPIDFTENKLMEPKIQPFNLYLYRDIDTYLVILGRMI